MEDITIPPHIAAEIEKTGKMFDFPVVILENFYKLGFLAGEVKGAYDTNTLYGKMLTGSVK